MPRAAAHPTPETISRVASLLQAGAGYKPVAKAPGVSDNTLARWRREAPASDSPLGRLWAQALSKRESGEWPLALVDD